MSYKILAPGSPPPAKTQFGADAPRNVHAGQAIASESLLRKKQGGSRMRLAQIDNVAPEGRAPLNESPAFPSRLWQAQGKTIHALARRNLGVRRLAL